MWIVWARWATVVLAVLCFVVAAARYRSWVCIRFRCVWPVAACLTGAAVLGYGAVETLRDDVPGGLRTWLVLIAMVAFLVEVSTSRDRLVCRAGQTGRWALPRARR